MLPKYDDMEVVERGLGPLGYFVGTMEPIFARETFRSIYGEPPSYFGNVWDFVSEDDFDGLTLEHILYARLIHCLLGHGMGDIGRANVVGNLYGGTSAMIYFNSEQVRIQAQLYNQSKTENRNRNISGSNSEFDSNNDSNNDSDNNNNEGNML